MAHLLRRTAHLLVGFVVLIPIALLHAQDTDPKVASVIGPNDPQPGTLVQEDKRMFGVLPNYRTTELNAPFVPITTKRKFYIAEKDTFDYPIFYLSGAFAGLYQLENQNPSFGQGMKGYAKRYVTSYADQAMGNILTEGAFPSLLHEDTRYFRKATGGTWSRVGYAASRVLVTRTDKGRWDFNYSEWLGNASAVAISNSYYPDTRHPSDNVEKLGIQIATDSFSNILKEFWPDIKRKMFHKGSKS